MRIETIESSRDFLSEHIGELPPESTSVALDEIALYEEPSIIAFYRDLLESAHNVGVEEAYRPWLAKQLLANWMASEDVATARKMLVERREELLGTDVEQALQSYLADQPDDPQLIAHRALLDLARTGQDDMLFQAIQDPDRNPDLLSDLARNGDFDALDSMATIMFFFQETDAERALLCFYKAIALAISKQPEKASDTVVEARRLDSTQVPNWFALLFKLPVEHRDEFIPLTEALVAPLPPGANGG